MITTSSGAWATQFDHRVRMHAIANALAERGVHATYEETPGFLAVTDEDGRAWNFGTANPTWGGECVADDGHTLFPAPDSDIPADSTDVRAIGDYIIRAIRSDADAVDVRAVLLARGREAFIETMIQREPHGATPMQLLALYRTFDHGALSLYAELLHETMSDRHALLDAQSVVHRWNLEYRWRLATRILQEQAAASERLARTMKLEEILLYGTADEVDTATDPSAPSARFSVAEQRDIVSRALTVIESDDDGDEHGQLIRELRRLVGELS